MPVAGGCCLLIGGFVSSNLKIIRLITSTFVLSQAADCCTAYSFHFILINLSMLSLPPRLFQSYLCSTLLCLCQATTGSPPKSWPPYLEMVGWCHSQERSTASLLPLPPPQLILMQQYAGQECPDEYFSTHSLGRRERERGGGRPAQIGYFKQI